MASPSELSLEYKPQSYSMLLKSFADQQIQSVDLQASQKLEEYLHRLEEERHKIDAFKRELPLCMQLLTNAMEASRQQLQSYRENNNQGMRPVLEEFIPLKHSNSNPEGISPSDQKPTVVSDKANWMTSAQLWSQAGDQENKQPSTLPKSEADNNIGLNVSPKLGLDTKQRNGGGGGAFLPFAKERNSNLDRNSSMRSIAELGLASGEREMEERKSEERENSDKVVGKAAESQTTTTSTTQTHRKARRCWSPDLHRRFVNALQMLGGSQVATPKQIRELMKVDGLTNDEVKSHLQKYRLHTRRPSCPSPQTAGAPTPQLVVLGGIWVPPEYATAHGGGPTIYGAHPTSQVSTHYCSPSPMVPPQDFYAPPPQPTPQGAPHLKLHHPAALLHPGNHHHNHQQQQQLHVYKTSSHTQTHSSPESDARGAGGDRSESIEDGKSESSSWNKGESGGENNGGERKRLAALRDDGEESNGSEITLKF